jgi:hypothetical protein
MQIGDTKSLKKALAAFCIMFAVVFVVYFCSIYFGRYGFTFAPFTHERDNLWPIIHHAAMLGLVAGFPAAGAVYGARKKKHEKSNDAA